MNIKLELEMRKQKEHCWQNGLKFSLKSYWAYLNQKRNFRRVKKKYYNKKKNYKNKKKLKLNKKISWSLKHVYFSVNSNQLGYVDIGLTSITLIDL